MKELLHSEAASGLLLVFVTAIALLWSNSPAGVGYTQLWALQPFGSPVTLQFVVNDILMAVFFLQIGLEIRREMHDGALSSVKAAALPLAAALGGVSVPALIFISLNDDPTALRGWAVPTATDIAFAVGVLSLLGKRVPPALRILLLALAIADDIAAILIIALFYADGVALSGMGVAATGVVALFVLNRQGVDALAPYLLCGVVLWAGLLAAGLHPTLAGVALGLLMPLGPARRLETTLHPWVVFAIMPVFALANAGVNVGNVDLGNEPAAALATGIVLGLVIGKPVGITLAAFLAVRAGWCVLPAGVTWSGIVLVGCLGGIGFTMSIFIATLAFPDPALREAAQLAVLAASAVASVVGLIAGTTLLRERKRGV